MLVCDKCDGSITRESSLCPHCGDPVTEADKPYQGTTADNVVQVKIAFGYSTSPSYETAVSIAKNIPTYIEVGEGKKTRHEVSLSISEVELIVNLYDIVGGWKSSRMLINGNPAKKSDLTYKGVGCFRNRQKAYDKEQFCFGTKEYNFNIWGCIRLDLPIYDWGGGWVQYGSLDKNGIWHFDKDKIRHELEVKIHEHELCPVLNRKRILDTLGNIPDSIDPRNDENWEYVTEYGGDDYDNDPIVGIRPVIKKANRYVMGDFSPQLEELSSGDSNNQDGQYSDTSPIAREVHIKVSLEEELPKPPVTSREDTNKAQNAARTKAVLFVLALFGSLLLFAIASLNR